MAQCVTCGAALHPERAQKYSYCMARACQEKNAKGLTMVAVGMNKAADELFILDDRTREDLASGRLRDQRRGTFGTAAPVTRPRPVPRAVRQAGQDARRTQRPSPRRSPAGTANTATRRPWSRSQEKLALLYNEQGLRPDEIAQKLGVSAYVVTQIILTARNRGKA